jgi:hypothetical protein
VVRGRARGKAEIGCRGWAVIGGGEFSALQIIACDRSIVEIL